MSEGSAGRSPGPRWFAHTTDVCAAVLPAVVLFMQRELSQSSQLPSIVLAPTNAVLRDYLTALRTLAADQAAGPAGAGSVGGGSSTQDNAKASMSAVPLEQLVDEFNRNSAVDSLLLLRRHCEYVALCLGFHAPGGC